MKNIKVDKYKQLVNLDQNCIMYCCFNPEIMCNFTCVVFECKRGDLILII